MTDANCISVIAFSPQPSVADLLKRVLDEAGFTASAAWGSPDELEMLVQRTNPDAVVYEVGFPFVEHWHQLQDLRSRPLLRSIPVVVVSGEPQELYRRVGASAAFEIFTYPNDRGEVRAAVCRAVDAWRERSREECTTSARLT
jgi:DNA-binding response OmpR family regulator